MQTIYMDHAATTTVRPEVMAAMMPYFSKRFGNPSSLYSLGQDAKGALEESRAEIARLIGAEPHEIVFTSGGTESNNLALKGTAFANRKRGKHIIVSAIEHKCVIHTAEWLRQQGFEISYAPVDRYGLVDPAVVEQLIRPDTICVSVMHANNEIGTVEPIEEIGKICQRNGVLFHTDAVQSFGKLQINVKKMPVDLLAASAHKIYGPKGVGFLYLRSGVSVEPLAHGGEQENGLRSGTENVAGIVGLATAARLAVKEMQKEEKRLTELRDRLIKGVLEIEDSFLNGHPVKRLPNNANFWFKYIEGESLVLHLNEKGIAASTGSACSSKTLKPSHVLLAIGLRHEQAHSSLRLTLGLENTPEHVNYLLKVLPPIVKKLRAISPFRKGA